MFFVDKLLFEDVVEDLFDFIEDLFLIVYNVMFDYGFFNVEFFGCGWLYLNCVWIVDMLVILKMWYFGVKYSFDVLCICYGIDCSYCV